MKSSAKEDAIEFRRETVAKLRVRGATMREICSTLKESGQVNPDTGREWSVGTIHGDITALSERWRENAKSDIHELKGRTRAQLEEIIRDGFGAEDRTAVLGAIKQMRDLYGMDEPRRTQLGGIPDGDPITVRSDPLAGINLDDLSTETLKRLHDAQRAIADAHSEQSAAILSESEGEAP